jgi:hypothetical protein
MTPWGIIDLVTVALVLGGALYIRLRWRRSPQAYRAMIVLAACYFVTGSILGAWVLHFVSPRSPQFPTASPSIAVPAPATSATGPPLNPQNTFSAKVVSITDGDTVDVLRSDNFTYAIRLAGIDAPEHDQALRPKRLNISPP